MRDIEKEELVDTVIAVLAALSAGAVLVLIIVGVVNYFG